MIEDVLLISEDYLKSESFLDDNMSGKYLLTAIKLAQDIQLQSIIGTELLRAIQQKVYDKTIGGDQTYKELLDRYIQPYLLYQVLNEIVVPVTFKIGNFGVMKSNDEKADNYDLEKVSYVKQYYQDKANVYKERLQRYLVGNRQMFPELNNFDFPKDVYPNLESSTSCPIWLGGPRGKIVNSGIDYKNLKDNDV